ncbi:chymotrypsin-1-like [Battus philenor]|uniref:chymotrypsin-1-like n=1 Tax=Battus philenor TaxID=42288 RepID=UPI0035CF0472
MPLRIHGGRDASPGEYPYVVRLEIQYFANFTNNTLVARHDHLCTASALTATWAITAAHCITDLSAYYIEDHYTEVKLVIRYGHVDSSTWTNNTFSDVITTVPYPLFIIADGTFNDYFVSRNDIGLVQTTPMHLISYIKLSAVDYLSLYGQEAIFAGFGITTEKLPEGEIVTDTLQLRKPLQILSVMITKCVKGLNIRPSVCLAPRCGHAVTACGGDSGGPLIHPSGIAGVLSIGPGTGHCMDSAPKSLVHYAGGIIPISPYIEWIHSYKMNNSPTRGCASNHGSNPTLENCNSRRAYVLLGREPRRKQERV